jgi:hypothetical protein
LIFDFVRQTYKELYLIIMSWIMLEIWQKEGMVSKNIKVKKPHATTKIIALQFYRLRVILDRCPICCVRAAERIGVLNVFTDPHGIMKRDNRTNPGGEVKTSREFSI